MTRMAQIGGPIVLLVLGVILMKVAWRQEGAPHVLVLTEGGEPRAVAGYFYVCAAGLLALACWCQTDRPRVGARLSVVVAIAGTLLALWLLA